MNWTKKDKEGLIFLIFALLLGVAYALVKIGVI
jgi:hypothetical protein